MFCGLKFQIEAPNLILKPVRIILGRLVGGPLTLRTNEHKIVTRGDNEILSEAKNSFSFDDVQLTYSELRVPLVVSITTRRRITAKI